MSFPKHNVITLDNKMRVLFIPIKNAHTIAVSVRIDSGFFEETKKQNGLAHYLEHIIAKHLMKKGIIEQKKNNIFFETSATTNKYRTNYQIYGDSQHEKTIIKQLLEMYNFTEDDLDLDVFKKEKVAVIVELKRILSSTDKKIMYKEIPEMMFGKRSKIINDIVDEIKQVRDFKPNDLFKYINTHYIPKKTLITIAGKFNKASILKYIKNNVPNNRNTAKIPKRIIPIKKITKPQLLYVKDSSKKLYNVSLRFFCYTSDKQTKIGILNILHKILSGIGDLSILKDRLRTKLGSIYSISTYNEINPYYGVFTISYSVEIQNFFKTLKEIILILKELKEQLFSPKLIKIAKEKYILNIKSTLNSNDPRDYMYYSNKLLNNEPLLNMHQYFDKYIQNVDIPHITKICNEIFNKNNVYMCYIGQKQLKNDLIENILSTL